MNYITFNEMIEVNGLLEEKGLNFKVHLRDACGKQSCWIEPLGNCACEGRFEEMYQVVEEYFRSKGQKIEFPMRTKLEFIFCCLIQYCGLPRSMILNSIAEL